MEYEGHGMTYRQTLLPVAFTDIKGMMRTNAFKVWPGRRAPPNDAGTVSVLMSNELNR